VRAAEQPCFRLKRRKKYRSAIVPRPFAPALLSSRAHSTLTATPDASSSAPEHPQQCPSHSKAANQSARRHEDGLRQLRIGAGEERRIRFSDIGFPEVRSEVDSNLSTTTCNFPPESFAISFNRHNSHRVRNQSLLQIRPRRKRQPRPHATSLPISAPHRFLIHAAAQATPAGPPEASAEAPLHRLHRITWRNPLRESRLVVNKRMTEPKNGTERDRDIGPAVIHDFCDSSFDCHPRIGSARIPFQTCILIAVGIQADGEVFAECLYPCLPSGSFSVNSSANRSYR